MKPTALENRLPDKREITALVIVMMAVTLPHAKHLDPLLTGFFVLGAGVRLLAVRYPRLLPGRWLLLALMAAGLALVLTWVPLNDGSLAGTALLVVMLGLKLLETRTRRDMHIIVFLGFFIILTQFLYQQAVWLALYLFLMSGLLIGLLTDANRYRSRPLASLATGGMQILAALPLALLLFLLFPRLESPLWSVTARNGTALTGISDHMRLGDIGQLSRSGATAFRVRFSGPMPDHRLLYWRGPVLWHFDGRTWSPGRPEARPPRVLGEPDSAVTYELTMEPSGQHWLFPLDVPTGIPGELQAGSDLQLATEHVLKERRLYRLSSHTRYRLLGLTPRQRTEGLQLPAATGPRTRALAAAWRRRHPGDDPAVVAEALAYFRTQPFVYTLSPGTSKGDPVEDFLFHRRRGFCEHYAGSFTLLMRLAGIPARVVVGYQGGSLNPIGKHLVVRQSDAHAWSEVWLGRQGWVRVDPTAAVTPERIEYPIDVARTDERGNIVFGVVGNSWLQQLVRNSRWMIDAVELGWYRWVLGFTPQRQQGLMKSLGLERFGYFAPAVGIGLLLLVFMSIAGLLLRQHTGTGHDPLQCAWRHYQRKLGKAGLNIPPWWGPEELLGHAVRRWPRHASAFRDITRRYVSLRYGALNERAQYRELRKRIYRLRIGH